MFRALKRLAVYGFKHVSWFNSVINFDFNIFSWAYSTVSAECSASQHRTQSRHSTRKQPFAVLPISPFVDQQYEYQSEVLKRVIVAWNNFYIFRMSFPTKADNKKINVWIMNDDSLCRLIWINAYIGIIECLFPCWTRRGTVTNVLKTRAGCFTSKTTLITQRIDRRLHSGFLRLVLLKLIYKSSFL